MTEWFMATCDTCGHTVHSADEKVRQRWARERHAQHEVRLWAAHDQPFPELIYMDGESEEIP